MAVAAKEDKGIDVSTDFLKNYIAAGGKAVDKESGSEVDSENVDEFLKEAGGGEKEQPESRKEMHKRAEKAAPSPEEEEARQKKEAAKLEAEAEKKRAAKRQTIRGAIGDVSDSIVDGAAPLADKIGSLSTVGGIGLLLVILVLLLFIIVQVNAKGDTRLKQLWFMINGQAALQGRVTPTGSSKEEIMGPQKSVTGESTVFNPTGSNNFVPLAEPIPFTSFRGNTPF